MEIAEHRIYYLSKTNIMHLYEMNISELKFSVDGNGNRYCYLNLNEDEDLKELKRNKI
jgi:hypothetical protein